MRRLQGRIRHLSGLRSSDTINPSPHIHYPTLACVGATFLESKRDSSTRFDSSSDAV